VDNLDLKYYHKPPIVRDDKLMIYDHLGGFDCNLSSHVLEQAISLARNNSITNVHTGYVFDETIRRLYPEIKFQYKNYLMGGPGWEQLLKYHIHPELDFKNFLCSFNGGDHVSRKLLVAHLHKLGWFNNNYSSKNFSFSKDTLDGHIIDFTGDKSRFYLKFFVDKQTDFFDQIISFEYTQVKHYDNVKHLEYKITQSFIHLVSETMATSYYPFITEKFLYSIVTRGLFLSWAQPLWHDHLEKFFGFKKYENLFDYSFDQILNPVDRLLALTSMISKFSSLSPDDWMDLYLLESDTIEYNYEHYFSKNYLKHLEKVS